MSRLPAGLMVSCDKLTATYVEATRKPQATDCCENKLLLPVPRSAQSQLVPCTAWLVSGVVQADSLSVLQQKDLVRQKNFSEALELLRSVDSLEHQEAEQHRRRLQQEHANALQAWLLLASFKCKTLYDCVPQHKAGSGMPHSMPASYIMCVNLGVLVVPINSSPLFILMQVHLRRTTTGSWISLPA